MQTSAQGIADLELHEGVVLKAYRCPAGVWTIGAGLTAASGVVKPRAGMTIPRSQATHLLKQALSRHYEPRVEKAMTQRLRRGDKVPAQHEFDGGVSFDFNTGAIHRASWVKAYLFGDWASVKLRLMQWVKGGGKVLPGLKRRREAELLMMRDGVYQSRYDTLPAATNAKSAKITAQLDLAEIDAAKIGFRKLGFDPGEGDGEVARAAVVAFQIKHDLVVDGILGRATLSTLQRQLDARDKALPAVGGTVVAGSASASGADDALSGLPYLTEAVLIGLALYGLWLAWRYRDAIAAAVQSPLPRVAAFLRSF